MYYGTFQFPNLLLNLHPDAAMAYPLLPAGPGHTTVVSEYLFRPETIAAPDFAPEPVVELWDLISRQDWEICERAQTGVVVIAGLQRPGCYPRKDRFLFDFNERYRGRDGPLRTSRLSRLRTHRPLRESVATDPAATVPARRRRPLDHQRTAVAPDRAAPHGRPDRTFVGIRGGADPRIILLLLVAQPDRRRTRSSTIMTRVEPFRGMFSLDKVAARPGFRARRRGDRRAHRMRRSSRR